MTQCSANEDHWSDSTRDASFTRHKYKWVVTSQLKKYRRAEQMCSQMYIYTNVYYTDLHFYC